MSAYQVYEEAIKPLSIGENLTTARLIMDEIVPDVVPQAESGYDHLKRILPQIERISLMEQDLVGVALNGPKS